VVTDYTKHHRLDYWFLDRLLGSPLDQKVGSDPACSIRLRHHVGGGAHGWNGAKFGQVLSEPNAVIVEYATDRSVIVSSSSVLRRLKFTPSANARRPEQEGVH
jgi:hypothetical protein